MGARARMKKFRRAVREYADKQSPAGRLQIVQELQAAGAISAKSALRLLAGESSEPTP